MENDSSPCENDPNNDGKKEEIVSIVFGVEKWDILLLLFGGGGGYLLKFEVGVTLLIFKKRNLIGIAIIKIH